MSTPLRSVRSASHRPVLWVWFAFALLLGSLNLVFKRFFPIDNARLGHDYSFVLPSWLDGYVWFEKNGLSAPWFSPSFCAGQPFFPDPQSAYYSIPQFLDIVAGPLNAAYLTLCLSATLMFWGAYLLMRKVFGAGPLVAVLVGGVLMFNGFLPHRIAIGHMGFHSFALVPLVALLLLMPIRSRVNAVGASVMAGLILAYWVHSGFGTLILAGGLAIFALGLLHCLRGGSFLQFLGRGVLASLVGLLLSASKLVASFSFLAFFPRTFYTLPGIASLYDTLVMIIATLFLESQHAAEIGLRSTKNLQLMLGPHEWAFNFSVLTAVLFLALLVNKLRSQTTFLRPSVRQAGLIIALLAALAWPVAFNYYDPQWNAFLKTVPVINSASVPERWIIVYIPIFAVAVGLMLERANWKQWTLPVVAACLLGTVIQSASESREFYLSQGYDARTMVLADQLMRSHQLSAEIKGLGVLAEIPVGSSQLKVAGNDLMAVGLSQVFCYNPTFGYQLEKFSATGLSPGLVFASKDGYLNLKNPACYVYPKENNCQPGDRFRADQIEEARKFVNYKPFAFNLSEKQKSANLLTEISLWVLALFMLAWLGWAAWFRAKKQAA